MKEEFKQINSVDELMNILNEEPSEACTFFVQLLIGRSWKTISLADTDDNSIEVYNEIDDSEEIISLEELNDPESTLGEAIKKGNLYFAWR